MNSSVPSAIYVIMPPYVCNLHLHGMEWCNCIHVQHACKSKKKDQEQRDLSSRIASAQYHWRCAGI